MRSKFVVTVIALGLLVGCAPKKVDTIGVNGGGSTIGGGSSSNGGGSIQGSGGSQIKNHAYENVDPYGRENHGNMEYNQNASYGSQSTGVQNIYFGVDQYLITAEKLPIIIHNANILKQATRSGSKVKIEGHCDASGTDEYNYALGLRRAKSAKDAIVVRGVDASSIKMVSMGESSPECTTDYSSDCFAKNRRVEFKIVE